MPLRFCRLNKVKGKPMDFFIAYVYDFSIKKKDKPKDIMYSLHLYFSGLSLRSTSKALSGFVQRIHTSIRGCIQEHKSERRLYCRRMVSKFVIDETYIQVRSELIRFWVAIESETVIFLQTLSNERNTFVFFFLSNPAIDYVKHRF